MECQIPQVNEPEESIIQILKNSKIVAMVGLSPKEERASNLVGMYLKENGYTIIPVNPIHPEILGEKSYKSLEDIPTNINIDIVNIFRAPKFMASITDQAIKLNAKTVWSQLGIVDNEAANKAKNAGLNVVMNKCLLIEHKRYLNS
jgi:uncharacterized protein